MADSAKPKGWEALEGRLLGEWAYPRLDTIAPGPPEAIEPPSLHTLRTLFDWAYLSLPVHTWSLSLQEQSDAVLRKVAEAARSLVPECRAFRHMAREPDKNLSEYLVLKALREVDIEDWLRDLHRDHPDEPYMAQHLDPSGRWPPGVPAGRS